MRLERIQGVFEDEWDAAWERGEAAMAAAEWNPENERTPAP